MDNEQKQIIKKIQKILRLANQAGSEEEAKTAMQMAHDLLARHHLTLTDVSSISEEQCKEEKLTFKGKSISGHIKLLVDAMCVLFQCRTVFIRDLRRKEISISFIGIDADPIVACQTYQFLLEFASRMAKERRIKSSEKSDYLFGFSHSILQRAIEIRGQQQNAPQENALVPAKEAAINKYLNRAYGKAKNLREPRQRFCSNSLMAGLEDGEKANLNRQVKGTSRKELA